MRTNEDRGMTFTPDFEGDEEAEPSYIGVDLMDDEPITAYNFNHKNFTIDQAKQLIECLQAAVDKYKEINK